MNKVFGVVWYLFLLCAAVVCLWFDKVQDALLYLVLACLAQRGAYDARND